jgi:SAM-dependent methyltransferase/methyltransferase-like protein
MSEAQLTSYENVPYDSKPLYPTHPDCLATVATLVGMQPVAVDHCRVLELGCATGGNLIPMAETLPNSRFVGIDLSPRQIASGRAVVDALRLTNIDLRPMSILDVDEDFGPFDYIICHGVYSWVPPEVQDKILSICARNLSPNGVAYVSYNTYPGWHARGMVREMMGFHARQFSDAPTRVQQARAFLEFLLRSVREPDGAYGRVLKEEAELLRPEADYYLFHEHLEDVNQPLYFYQFAQRLAARRLQYLGESWLHTNPGAFPPDVQSVLQELSSDLLHLEQYIDFLTNRTFRRTLLCHDRIQLTRAPSAKTVSTLQMTALARPVAPPPDVSSSAVGAFRADDGLTVSTNIPVVKAALVSLFEVWPAALSFDALWSAVCLRLAGTPDSATESARSPELLAESLLQCYLSNLVAFHVRASRFVRQAGPRPVASPLARHQSASGSPITNLRHRIVQLSDSDRRVLSYLDGSHDRPAIVELLKRAGGAAESGLTLAESLEASLQRLAQSALLVQ